MPTFTALAFETLALQSTNQPDPVKAKDLLRGLLNGTDGNREWRISSHTELPNEFYAIAVRLGWGAFENGTFRVYALGKQVAREALSILNKDATPELV